MSIKQQIIALLRSELYRPELARPLADKILELCECKQKPIKVYK